MFDFYKKYSDYSNLQLVNVLERADDYQPEAVAAAQRILNEREVTSAQQRALVEELKANPIAVASTRSRPRMSLLTKLALFLIPPIGLIIWLPLYLNRETDNVRHREAGRYLFYGLLLFLTLGILLARQYGLFAGF